MKQALALLFLAGSSIVSALPSSHINSMDMGTATDTLATNQKTTAIQIKNEVLPKIERNFNLYFQNVFLIRMQRRINCIYQTNIEWLISNHLYLNHSWKSVR